jgi:hypothetical protein
MAWRHTVGVTIVLLVVTTLQAAERPQLKHRWIYLSTNLLVGENVERDLALLRRAANAGYTGVVLTDSKFMRWDGLPERYVHNVARVRQACRDFSGPGVGINEDNPCQLEDEPLRLLMRAQGRRDVRVRERDVEEITLASDT